ncbi:MAG: hypothetical protein KDA24_12275 [Deltaproteobacteria bacterium]|nr:hypothetical protein [Deltaproteobacteria bacterium]
MTDRPKLTIYAAPELGAYGYSEKPWYQPGERRQTFLGAVADRAPELSHAEAPPADDAALSLFHTPDHIAWVTARCATDQGSLDEAPPQVNARSRQLLAAIADADGSPVTAEQLTQVLGELDATLAAFAPFLQSEELVTYDGAADAVEITEAGRAFLADPDASLGGPTYARAGVEQAARYVCGAVLDAVARIAAGELRKVFVPIAGFHHAHRDRARMYCLYNDPGLAIEAALSAFDGPVAYIDVDIHHGDGVYEAFAAHPRVVIADIHEGHPSEVAAGGVERTGFVGLGEGIGNKRALAVGHGTTDAAYLDAWDDLEDFVRAAKPCFIVFEAGVDGLATDPMSHQALTPAVFEHVARRVAAIADTHADGRLLALGGGGYEATGLAAGWAAVVRGLLDPD